MFKKFDSHSALGLFLGSVLVGFAALHIFSPPRQPVLVAEETEQTVEQRHRSPVGLTVTAKPGVRVGNSGLMIKMNGNLGFGL